MQKGEVTYIFGAGASCQSMPLVNGFSKRFEIFNRALKNAGINDDSRLMNDCIVFLEQVKKHLSFDTFFKKMFHQNEESDIMKYKKILLLFFIFEHIVDPKFYNQIVN